MIRNLQAAAPRANATSFAYEVYRHMPNDTDLTVFKGAGLAGLNFAFIEHPEWYHHAEDDPDHLDRRSLQEHGDYALRLARQFGGQDLAITATSGDAVYFPTKLTGLIVYPASCALPLAWITAAGLAAAAIVAWRRRRRGLWMAAAMAVPVVLQLMVARSAPGVSYVFEWPLLGGILAFAVVMTARETIGADWRLAALLLAPAGAFQLIAPMLRALIVALGPATGGVVAAVAALFLLITVAPQLALILRRSA
jgi:hypothetical protein